MKRMGMMTSRFVSVAALCLLCAFSAGASPIFVNNFSFEALPASGLNNDSCSPGCFFSIGAIPGWSNTGTSGQFQGGVQVGDHLYFNALSDGDTVAYSNGPTISQAVTTPANVPVTVVPGETYTLMVDLSRRNGGPFQTFTAGADLLINGRTIAATGVVPAQGNWSTFTATYIGSPLDIGQQITIQLTSSGSQAEFDNVRLSTAAVTSGVPEPSGVTLLGLGLAGLLAVARRKRTN